MRLPQAFQMEVIRTHAIRAKASGTMGDAATLIDYVSKVFELPYEKAATVTMRKYGIRYAEKAYAGRQSGFTLKDPSRNSCMYSHFLPDLARKNIKKRRAKKLCPIPYSQPMSKSFSSTQGRKRSWPLHCFDLRSFVFFFNIV